MTTKKPVRYIVYLLAIIGFLTIASQSARALLLSVFWLTLIFGAYLIYRSFKKAQPKSDALPILSSEKEKHYQDLGMADAQVLFFRETMDTAKKQIIQLEKNMTDVAKLKAIDLRNDTLKAAKAIFKELVKSPKKLHQADRFLYNHLPNLVDLTNKYLEINDHELKTKNTYEALDKSSKVIDEVAKLLALDYEKFVADDLDDLDVEMTLAQQNISREEKTAPLEEEKEI